MHAVEIENCLKRPSWFLGMVLVVEKCKKHSRKEDLMPPFTYHLRATF